MLEIKKKKTECFGLNFLPFIFTGYICRGGLSHGLLAYKQQDLWAKLASFHATVAKAAARKSDRVDVPFQSFVQFLRAFICVLR